MAKLNFLNSKYISHFLIGLGLLTFFLCCFTEAEAITKSKQKLHNGSSTRGFRKLKNLGAQRISTSRNLAECHRIYQRVGVSQLGFKTCQSAVGHFNFTDPNFQACVGIYRQGAHRSEVPSTCMILSKKFQFVKNKTFERCFIDQKQKIKLDEAATACMNYVNNLKYLQDFSS